jgi:oligopeptide/dipeptide ABC transporter ATP-binding protein
MKEVCKDFNGLQAVHHVNLCIHPGETIALVGESGCGKSTLGRLLMRLHTPTSGVILYDGEPLKQNDRKQQREMQIVFQDPYASLNPRMTLADIICEPLTIHHWGSTKDCLARCKQLLAWVGLPLEFLKRYPHELSGGQRQRVGIARAIALEPRFLVCDEPVSALDANTQKQVISVLKDLKERLGLTYLFISHDLNVVKSIADRVVVMYLGRIVEMGTTEQLYNHPKHPYTQALLSAIPVPDPKVERTRSRIVLQGELPNPCKPPSGCVFHTRCPRVHAECKLTAPTLTKGSACHFE